HVSMNDAVRGFLQPRDFFDGVLTEVIKGQNPPQNRGKDADGIEDGRAILGLPQPMKRGGRAGVGQVGGLGGRFAPWFFKAAQAATRDDNAAKPLGEGSGGFKLRKLAVDNEKCFLDGVLGGMLIVEQRVS